VRLTKLLQKHSKLLGLMIVLVYCEPESGSLLSWQGQPFHCSE